MPDLGEAGGVHRGRIHDLGWKGAQEPAGLQWMVGLVKTRELRRGLISQLQLLCSGGQYEVGGVDLCHLDDGSTCPSMYAGREAMFCQIWPSLD